MCPGSGIGQIDFTAALRHFTSMTRLTVSSTVNGDFIQPISYTLPLLSTINLQGYFIGWARRFLPSCPNIRSLIVNDKRYDTVMGTEGVNIVQALHRISFPRLHRIDFLNTHVDKEAVPITATDVQLLVENKPKLKTLLLPAGSMLPKELKELSAYLAATPSAQRKTREWRCLNALCASLTRGANG